MNVIFAIIFTISALTLTFISPDGVLKAMTDGANKSVTLSIGLISVYSVWSAVLQIAEDSGLVKKLASALKPLIDRLFKKTDEKTSGKIAVNLSANLLGMGGIATPSGIEATSLMTDKNNHDGACLLFILASTSLQILPTTVVSVRQAFNSKAPFDIFLPSLLSSAVCTAIGVTLYFLTQRIKK